MVRIFKKYANRKIYDTFESQYITLCDLREIVKSGQDVKVITHEEGIDVTYNTMVQVFHELANNITDFSAFKTNNGYEIDNALTNKIINLIKTF